MRAPYYIFFQLLSLVVALIYFKQLRKFSLQVMVPLLIFVCTIELLATNVFKAYNLHVYNIYAVFSPLFYFFLFSKLIRFSSAARYAYIAISIISFFFFLLDYFFIKPGEYDYYSAVVSLIEYLFLGCIVLSQLVMDDNKRIGLSHEPYFWIVTGIIIFSLVTIVILGLHSYILRNDIKIFGKRAYRVIMPMVNVIMYSCFAYAFYLCKTYEAKLFNRNSQMPGTRQL